ncbi:MAG: hypothetical protein LBS86_05420, partial [Treponema sp.]|nr:hypothetical protein [Treponema sp.]
MVNLSSILRHPPSGAVMIFPHFSPSFFAIITFEVPERLHCVPWFEARSLRFFKSGAIAQLVEQI